MICEVGQERGLARVDVGWLGMLEIGQGEAQVIGLD